MSKSKSSLNLQTGLLHGFGLLMFIPFLYYRGTDPLTNFANEWIAFLIGLILITVFLFSLKSLTLRIPVVSNLPISLGLIIAVQMIVMPDLVEANAQLAILYLLWSALLMIVAANLVDSVNRDKAIEIFCFYLVAGGIWNILFEFNHVAYSHGVIKILTILGSGSIGQANHLCNYLFLASSSLLCLYVRKVINWPVLALILLFFTAEISISGSRSSFLYLLAIGLLIWVWRAKLPAESYQRLYKSFLLLALLFLFWQTINTQLGLHTGANRAITYISDASTPNYRLWIWREAWEMFLQAPLLGVGFGEFDWAFFKHSMIHSHAVIDNRIENAHNLFLQTMAEMGIAGLLCVVVFGGLWVKQLLKTQQAQQNIETWWLFAILSILGIHSLLEYPLWYSYFLGIFALLLAITEKRQYVVKISRLTRTVACLIPVFASGLLVDTGRDFLTLEKYYEAARLGLKLPGDTKDLVPVCNAGLLKYFGLKYFAGISGMAGDYSLAERAEFNEKVIHFEPIPPLVYKQAAYLALQGKQPEALDVLQLATSSYPKELNSFIADIAALPIAEQHKLTFLGLAPSVKNVLEKK